ncbi:outer membrane beta-barrel protein [Psychroflexus montanilacus]|uniref:outer membrane beta-barrel protein n=1 Tax=Psychroflexus montanilacus TaxID=2873598 RepID=UPI001CC9445E|nr:outer membrane beta-barrel protein [Psychroflexus montanilacus]MBZ9650937.1 outer membrane beta-barrel protein [Psychroflexus montanilacus]
MYTLHSMTNSTTRIYQSIIIVALLFLGSITTQAQSDNKQSDVRLSVGPQLNFAKLNLESSQFNSSFKQGGGFTAGISMALNENWSLHSGAGLNFYKGESSINTYSGIEPATDISGEDFEFRYTANGYVEEQSFTALSVPLAIQYETKGVLGFYAKLGLEANLFFSEESQSSANSLTTTGFFPRFNAVLDSPRFAGFGTYDNQNFNTSDLDLKTSYNATTEIGIKQMYTSGNAFYVGVYYKYGINDISGDSNSNGPVSFDSQNPTDFRSTSVINAVDTTQSNSERLTSEARLHVFGVALRFEFSL